ncbi:Guanine nucleotide exchange factor lte1 [Basidiobolus ranarum]|uniref:Guanine nucleotide exchange factor lte1 n=1 Tax=Basidiobolus ranarum TaxID=34480 RepID=A0ABR2WQ78_9FUNG
MWPSSWRKPPVGKVEPSSLSYGTQKSTRKLFLFAFKKGILEKDLFTDLDISGKVERNSVQPTTSAMYTTDMNNSPTFSYSKNKTVSAAPMGEVESDILENIIRNPEESNRDEIPSSKKLNQPTSLSRPSKLTSAATLETLIDTLVTEADYKFTSDFFLTYRLFMSPVQLCKALNSIFLDSLNIDCLIGENIRTRVSQVIHYWLKEYFAYDFAPSAALRFTLGNFLKSIRTHPQVTSSVKNAELVAGMCGLYKHSKFYFKKLTQQQHSHPSTSMNIRPTREKKSRQELHHKCSLDSMISSLSQRTVSSRLDQSDLALLNLSVEPPNDNSLNQWTMRMVCGLASLKSRIPEVYNSLISGVPPSPEPRHSTAISDYSVNSELRKSPTYSICDSMGDFRQGKSFLCFYSTEMIAQQFCIIEQRCLCAVEWHELVEVLWKNRSDQKSNEKCYGVLSQIDRFNIMCQWVATEVVTSESIDVRARIIEKLIRIAMRCYQHRNYSTLLQILLGLQSSNIARLARTWKRVGMHEKRTFEELKRFTSPCKNWTNIRSAMHEASEDYRYLMWSDSEREHSKMIGEACIPFFGLFLSDLTYNSELPSYLPPTSEDTSELINFHKHCITASVIKRLLAFQALSKRYPFLPDVSVYPKCLFLKYMSEPEIRQLSSRCE